MSNTKALLFKAVCAILDIEGDVYIMETKIYILTGRIDSSNAPQLEADITKALGEEYCNVIFDASELEYVSSAGLRVFMRVKKNAKGTVSIVDVTPEVFEIFDMTGFTQILDVKKQLRQVSVDGCEIIGQGGNGAVYRLDPDTIIKVYKESASLDKISTERDHAQAAFLHGIPTAISYDTVRVGKAYGIVFELLDAKTVGRTMSDEPDRLPALGAEMGKLLKTLHTTEMEEGVLPKMNDKISGWIDYMEEQKYLGADDIALMRDVLSKIPERNTLIHSDFQEGNVMVQNGELILIDLDDICTGHPIYDLAFNYMSHVLAQGVPDIIRRSLNLEPEAALEARNYMMREYFSGADDAQLGSIDKIIAATSMFMSSFIPAKSRDSANMTPELIQSTLDTFMPVFREAAPTLPQMIGALGL